MIFVISAGVNLFFIGDWLALLCSLLKFHFLSAASASKNTAGSLVGIYLATVPLNSTSIPRFSSIEWYCSVLIYCSISSSSSTVNFRVWLVNCYIFYCYSPNYKLYETSPCFLIAYDSTQVRVGNWLHFFFWVVLYSAIFFYSVFRWFVRTLFYSITFFASFFIFPSTLSIKLVSSRYSQYWLVWFFIRVHLLSILVGYFFNAISPVCSLLIPMRCCGHYVPIVAFIIELGYFVK